MYRCSISQLKNYNANPAEWIGNKVFGFPKKHIAPEAMVTGILVENHYTEQKPFDVILAEQKEKHPELDIEKVIEYFDQAIKNSAGLDRIEGKYQVKVEYELGGVPFLGYIDVLQGDTIIDIKVKGTNEKVETISMFSGMSKKDEYELQLWFYMKATGLRKSKIIEIVRYPYKTAKYAVNEYEFDWTEEMDKKWTIFAKEKSQEMRDIYNKYITFANQ